MSEWGEASIDAVHKHIMSFLTVAQVCEDNSDGKYPATITYVITNTRPAASSPKIVYEDVELIVTTPIERQVVKVGKLECEQSF